MGARGRHEIKHYINYSDFLRLRATLPHVATRDKHAADEDGYRVRSLYFDNYADKALREKLDGLQKKEKFRFRIYNDDPSYIQLEKKSKVDRLCYKEKTVVSPALCTAVLAGDYDVLKDSGDRLLFELYTKMHYELLRPQNIVDYMREAYVFSAGNVRVTIDYDIRTSFDVKAFLDPQFVSIPMPGKMILEVKYDAFLPEVIRGAVSLSSRHQTAFSKYAATRII